ncbi:hypothetical protein PENTCL1PPCAC_8063, partial [Pristionchus entomophagus]
NTSSAGMIEPDSIDGITDPIWFREGSNGEKNGPFPLAIVSKWYERNQLIPSVELSADDGKRWSSIVSLRLRNGPTFPFSSFDDNQPSGKRSIEITREMVSNARSEVVRLENQIQSFIRQLGEEERVLEKLKEMEKILDPDSFTDSNVQSRADTEGESDREVCEYMYRNLDELFFSMFSGIFWQCIRQRRNDGRVWNI